MTNFMLLYSGGMGPDDMSEEERGKVMAAWEAWYGKLGEAIVDGGNPFSGSKGIASDGTVSTTAALAGATGYTVVSADSLDAAVALSKDHPHLAAGGQISVYETFQVM
jgi:hypothetical protein